MKLEQQLFMDILRAFAAEESFCLPVIDPDWEELLHLSRIQDTEGIIGYELMHSPHLTPELRDVMHRCFLQTVGTCAKRAGKMAGLVRLMNDRGIEHLLVKGYLVRELYPVPELRTFGDIDFLIHLEDREKCDALLMEEGFQRTVDWEPVYSYVRKDEYYEVHTDIMEVDVSDKADYKGYFSQVWQHAVRQEGYTFVPEIQFHLLYLLTHLAKHITSSGAGMVYSALFMMMICHLRKKRICFMKASMT
ncbi:MAG: nucleotidyltransferase family protein, partial [Solobacterium sp.]|nr:nucleotidyltransferase family protein [Solobacterium sp.]